MHPIRTSIEIAFLIALFALACFFGAGYLPEKGRQFATAPNSVVPETESGNKTHELITTYIAEPTENGTWTPSIQYITDNKSRHDVKAKLIDVAKYTLNRKTAKISFDFLVELKKIPFGSALAIGGLPVVVENGHITEFNIHQTGLNYSGELTVSMRPHTTYFGVMVNTGRVEKEYLTDGSEDSVRFWGYIIYQSTTNLF